MSSSTRQALLKVIAGHHAGAELLLSEGRNTIGSGDDCDIVLHDDQLGECHAALDVTGTTVVVEALNGSAVHVDGTPVTRVQLRPFQVVTVGQTHVAVGPSSEPWPALKPPQIAAPAAEEPAAATADAQPVAVANEKPVVAVAPKKERRRGGTAAVIVAGVVLALLAWWWNTGEPQSMTSAADRRADVQRQLDEVVGKFQSGTSELKVEEKGNQWAVTGYVPTLEVRRELATALKKVPAAVRNNVVDTAGLADAAGRVLKMHRLDLTVTAGGPGEVIVSGRTGNPLAWNGLKSRLMTDVPKIRTLTDRVNGATPTPPPVEIAKAPEPEPAPKPAEPAPVVTHPTAAMAEVAPPPPVIPELPIRSLTVGKSRSLVLESGEKLFEGAVLATGHTIKSIAADKVILEKNGQETVVPVGGGR